MGDAGIALDSSGNLYVETGNGGPWPNILVSSFDLSMGGRNASMSVLKLDPTAKMMDWFAPHDAAALGAVPNSDVDLGSTGPLILPDSISVPGHPHLMIASFSTPGGLIMLSANGNTAGIIWASEGQGYQPTGNAALHAYDALDLTKELWNSNQAPGMRDQAALIAKYAMPTIANGRVYFGTQTELEVYGLLP